MNASEAAWQLHLENIALRKRPKIKQAIRHCVYCGAPCIGPVCPAHHDLIELDEGAPS